MTAFRILRFMYELYEQFVKYVMNELSTQVGHLLPTADCPNPLIHLLPVPAALISGPADNSASCLFSKLIDSPGVNDIARSQHHHCFDP